jgi:hypothetical protein
MKQFGCEVVKKQQHYRWFIVFDMEAILHKWVKQIRRQLGSISINLCQWQYVAISQVSLLFIKIDIKKYCWCLYIKLLCLV